MIFLNDYDYYLPANLIAKEPVSPRDSSRLFIYDTKSDKISFDKFINLHKYLPKKSLLVLNKTKVIPARVILYKENKAIVKVLFLVNEVLNEENTIRAFIDRKVNLGEKLFFNSNYFVEVLKQDKHIFTFKLNFSKKKLFELLEKQGKMPIPLYIKDTPLKEYELRKKYQTIFASSVVDELGSEAAPTASLHFTNRVFQKLAKKGIDKTFVTLHVGMGTFSPIDEENIHEKKLHEEWFEISKETVRSINLARRDGKKIVAVGTTVVRTLESVGISSAESADWLKSVKSVRNKTDLFIFPPHNFKTVDYMITNFHLPKSSLVLLVEAFLKFKNAKKDLINLYQIAISEKFRFYSFGDAMLIL